MHRKPFWAFLDTFIFFPYEQDQDDWFIKTIENWSIKTIDQSRQLIDQDDWSYNNVH